MRTFQLVILSALCLLLFVLPVRAEESKSDSSSGHGWPYAAWITIASGPRVGGGDFARYLSFTLTSQSGYGVVARSATVDNDQTSPSVDDLALMLSRRFNLSPGAMVIASLGAAVSRYQQHNYGSWSGPRRTTGGLAGQVEFIAPLQIHCGGLGLTVYGNASPDAPFAAFGISFLIGYVR